MDAEQLKEYQERMKARWARENPTETEAAADGEPFYYIRLGFLAEGKPGEGMFEYVRFLQTSCGKLVQGFRGILFVSREVSFLLITPGLGRKLS